jgi:hypothetical protein
MLPLVIQLDQHLDRRRIHFQLHSSSDGPKAPQVGIDVMVPPAPPVPLLDAAPPAPLDPKPLLFGLVAVLQNVAVVSSWQIMPVSVSGELFVVPPAPSACCCDCAAAGDAAKSSAETIATFVISATHFLRAPPNRNVGMQLDFETNYYERWYFTHDK